MVNIDRVIANDSDLRDCYLILQIHDELIYEVPKTLAKKMAMVMKEQMENAVQLSLKLTVELCVLLHLSLLKFDYLSHILRQRRRRALGVDASVRSGYLSLILKGCDHVQSFLSFSRGSLSLRNKGPLDTEPLSLQEWRHLRREDAGVEREPLEWKICEPGGNLS